MLETFFYHVYEFLTSTPVTPVIPITASSSTPVSTVSFTVT